MRNALARLIESINEILDVANDMDARLLTSDAAARRRDEILRCACTVILSGFFETFLKESAERFIHNICSRKIPFSQLPPKTQMRHFVQGGAILGQKAKGDSRVSWISASHLDIVSRLSSPAASSTYSLVWEAYATTEGNPGPDVIDRLLEHLGVDNRQPRLNAALSGNYPTVKLQLKSFIEIRNECAHTGTAANAPTTGNLRDYCDLLQRISTAIVDVLELRLSEAPFGLNLNVATSSQLSLIPGLGASKVAAIVASRQLAAFLSVDDVAKLPGFGPAIIKILKLHAHI